MVSRPPCAWVGVALSRTSLMRSTRRSEEPFKEYLPHERLGGDVALARHASITIAVDALWGSAPTERRSCSRSSNDGLGNDGTTDTQMSVVHACRVQQ